MQWSPTKLKVGGEEIEGELFATSKYRYRIYQIDTRWFYRISQKTRIQEGGPFLGRRHVIAALIQQYGVIDEELK